MPATIGFTPRHAQPFTLEQAMLLEIEVLIAEVSRLENSLRHLRNTQDELRGFLKSDPDGDKGGELAQAMNENEETIASQTERIALIKVALMNKIGEGGMRHYGLDSGLEDGKPAGTPGAAASAASAAPANPADGAHPDVTPRSAGGAAPTSRAEPEAREAHEANDADGLYL